MLGRQDPISRLDKKKSPDVGELDRPRKQKKEKWRMEGLRRASN